MKLLMIGLFCICFIILSSASKTLVIVRDIADKTTYSNFLRDLKNRGHDLTFKTASDASIKLESYGVYNYDNVIILSPNSKKIGSLTGKDLLKYVDSGRNLLVGLDEKVSKMFKNLASNLGIEIKGGFVTDHFTYNELVSDTKNDTFITSRAFLGYPATEGIKNPVSYRGSGFTFRERTSYGLHLLTAEDTGYSKAGAGSELGLVTALQTRDNARATFVGSLKLLTNQEALSSIQVQGVKSSSGNTKFVQQIVAWTFKERGFLRSRDAKHYLIPDGDISPNRYTIGQDVHYEVIIEEYDMYSNSWKPYVAKDVQFQLVRLDPFIRTLLDTDGSGLFYLDFKLPDTMGIFKFIVDYKRKGYTYIYEEQTAAVRPLRHDQHERFLLPAYPYYAAMLSTLFGFFTFSVFFVHSTSPTKIKAD